MTLQEYYPIEETDELNDAAYFWEKADKTKTNCPAFSQNDLWLALCGFAKNKEDLLETLPPDF